MNRNQSTASNLYQISNWGDDYFSINTDGNIEVKTAHHHQAVELQAIVKEAARAGLQLPLLIRFTDILQDRVVKLIDAFQKAIVDHDYQGSYQLIYPIKVNQESSVVKALLATTNYSIGLEAGSKPELMAVMGLLSDKPATIICNGYKDSAYIRLALIAQQMGHNVFIVIEKYSEVDIIIEQSLKLQIKPNLGVRIRLVTKSAGKWENTGGVKSKFGLNAAQVLDLIDLLKTHQLLDCLQLMHCHLGSQVANIFDIHHCMQEVARYYLALRRLGAAITTIDVGGGLAVDYDGSHSVNDCSMNYSLYEYASHILLALQPLCQNANMPEPNLISESGRALTAQHAVLISNINDVEYVCSDVMSQIDEDASQVLCDIWRTYQDSLYSGFNHECYHSAFMALEDAHSMFKHGLISLDEKAKVERIFMAICLQLQTQLQEQSTADLNLLHDLNERTAAKIFCNLSFFQSIPDAWAIGQIFPIAPLSHLKDSVKIQSILYDLTCDSDGTIKTYTSCSGLSNTLMLPLYDARDPYLLGFFLVGAYQEILGNLHNLFGDTNSLDVTLSAAGEFQISKLVTGDTVDNVLNFAHYASKDLLLSYEKQLIAAELPNELCQIYLNELRSVFTQLTYLDTYKK